MSINISSFIFIIIFQIVVLVAAVVFVFFSFMGGGGGVGGGGIYFCGFWLVIPLTTYVCLCTFEIVGFIDLGEERSRSCQRFNAVTLLHHTLSDSSTQITNSQAHLSAIVRES